MKQTLLDITQDILSDMGSDQINALGDTEEANQVVRIIKSVFSELIVRKDWPHLRVAGQLTNLSDDSKPTHMLIPEDSTKLDYLAYDQRKTSSESVVYRRVVYKYPDDFLAYTNRRNPENENVTTVVDGLTLYIYNDKAPTYYTSFDDKHIVFDSWNEDISTTVSAQSSQCVYYRAPVWSSTDTFVPDLPAEAFPGFLAEAKSTCFARLKQMADQKSEQQSQRQNVLMAQRNFVVKGGVRYNNYGRRSGKSSSGRNFNNNQFGGTSSSGSPGWQP